MEFDISEQIRKYEECKIFHDKNKTFEIANVCDVLIRHLNALFSYEQDLIKERNEILKQELIIKINNVRKGMNELEEYLNILLNRLEQNGNSIVIIENNEEKMQIISRNGFNSILIREEKYGGYIYEMAAEYFLITLNEEHKINFINNLSNFTDVECKIEFSHTNTYKLIFKPKQKFKYPILETFDLLKNIIINNFPEIKCSVDAYGDMDEDVEIF